METGRCVRKEYIYMYLVRSLGYTTTPSTSGSHPTQSFASDVEESSVQRGT